MTKEGPHSEIFSFLTQGYDHKLEAKDKVTDSGSSNIYSKSCKNKGYCEDENDTLMTADYEILANKIKGKQ